MDLQHTIHLHDISFAYGDSKPVVHNLTISFPRQKIIAMVGLSGSGKSTILQIINGMLTPSSGYVSIFGERLTDDNAKTLRQKTGYVVQGGGLFPHLTISQNISLMARVKGENPDPERIHELLESVNLSEAYLNRLPHELSGGEQQRISICRALYHDPEILLLDESLGALDSVTRKDIQMEIMAIHARTPKTILLVTHDIQEARRVADLIAVIRDGKIQQYAQKDEVLSSPANPYVAALIEAS